VTGAVSPAVEGATTPAPDAPDAPETIAAEETADREPAAKHTEKAPRQNRAPRHPRGARSRLSAGLSGHPGAGTVTPASCRGIRGGR
jgi:hypothetical protein